MPDTWLVDTTVVAIVDCYQMWTDPNPPIQGLQKTSFFQMDRGQLSKACCCGKVTGNIGLASCLLFIVKSRAVHCCIMHSVVTTVVACIHLAAVVH